MMKRGKLKGEGVIPKFGLLCAHIVGYLNPALALMLTTLSARANRIQSNLRPLHETAWKKAARLSAIPFQAGYTAKIHDKEWATRTGNQSQTRLRASSESSL